MAENTAAGEDIGDAIAATDPESDDLTYSLSGTDFAAFAIDSGSGQLQTKADLDYETTASYSVTVIVKDPKDVDGYPDQVTDDTITVSITVTDVDPEAAASITPANPVVDTKLTASLDEPVGVSAGTTTWVWVSSANGSTDWSDISGATLDNYTPADVNSYLRASATFTDNDDVRKTARAVTASAVAAATPVTNNAPVFDGTSLTVAANDKIPAGAAWGAGHRHRHGHRRHPDLLAGRRRWQLGRLQLLRH